MRISDWSSDVCSSDLAPRRDLERLCHGADGRLVADLVLPAPQEEKGMKRIRLTPLFFRRIHKWVGLILGLQFLLWALSGRSEEHTSELQSLMRISYAVFCLKKKK